MENVFLKVLSEISIGGIIHEVGKIIEVAEHEAISLLHRGVCDVATEDDAAPVKEEVAEPAAPAPANDAAPATEAEPESK